MSATETFDTWPLTPLCLLPRSRLYRLEPIGIGTRSVEGLTSYVMRLAAAHAVRVGDLVGHELFPGDSPGIRKSVRTKRVYSHGFPGASYWMGGAGACPVAWVAALQRSTLQNNLHFLTLLPFATVLSERLLFRQRRAWCPACLEEQRTAGQAVHEFLVWGLRIVSVCAHHKRPLEEICPHCARSMQPLAIYSRPGRCSVCTGWLGVVQPMVSIPDVSDYDLWSAAAVGDLLARVHNLKTDLLGTTFTLNLSVMIKKLAGGNRAAFAYAADCSLTVVGDWLRGTTPPRLDIVLPMCYRLNIVPADLFGDVFPATTASLQPVVMTDRKVRSLRRRAEVNTTLKEALIEDPPPTLLGLARRIGYRSTSWLCKIDPATCKEIMARNRHWNRKHLGRSDRRVCRDLGEIKMALETALTQRQAIPLCEVTGKLGYVSPQWVQKKFPAMCHAISDRFTKERHARTDLVLRQALEEDPPPTMFKMVQRVRFASAAALRRSFGDVCDQLLDRRAAFREARAAKLRKLLEAALTEDPAPSIRTLCQRLDLHTVMFAKMFPDLWTAISARFRQAIKERAGIRRDHLREEVRQIVIEMWRQGVYPGVDRVWAALSQTSLKDWTVLIPACEQTKEELGIN